MKYIFEIDGDIGTEGTIHYQVADGNVPGEAHEVFEVDRLRKEIQYLANQNERLRGVIEGLRFGLRCNGVSGAEVQE